MDEEEMKEIEFEIVDYLIENLGQNSRWCFEEI